METYEYALPIGTVITSPQGNRYTVREVLGQGGFGITYRVSGNVKYGNISIEGRFAIKEFFLKSACDRADDHVTLHYSAPTRAEVEDGRDAFIKEGRRLNEICTAIPGIVKVNEVFEANNTAYFVMEFLDGKDLRTTMRERLKRQGPYKETEALGIVREVGATMVEVHKACILHLDIKPDNIMLCRDEENGRDVPVLIDFGISAHFTQKGKITHSQHTAGFTEGYSPLEQYARITRFAPEMDVYALAATLFYLLTGHDPVTAGEIDSKYLMSELRKHDVSERTCCAVCRAMESSRVARTPSMAAFLNELTDPADPDIPRPQDRRTKPFSPQRPVKKMLWSAAVVICTIGIAAAIFINHGSETEPSDSASSLVDSTPVDSPIPMQIDEENKEEADTCATIIDDEKRDKEQGEKDEPGEKTENKELDKSSDKKDTGSTKQQESHKQNKTGSSSGGSGKETGSNTSYRNKNVNYQEEGYKAIDAGNDTYAARLAQEAYNKNKISNARNIVHELHRRGYYNLHKLPDWYK